MTVFGPESKHREVNKSSMLLSQEENKTVLALIGPRCQTLATTVAQVYRSEGPSHNYRWNKRTCGVVCFVKDNLRRSYFIRVYDMDRMVLVFDQEIYNQFRYKAPRPYFHTFEGDEAQIGLNFADETEAELFQQTVESKLTERKLRREKRQASRRQHTGNGVNSQGVSNGILPKTVTPQNNSVSYPAFTGNNAMAKKGVKGKIKKEDIGLPTNFQHISHVGWDPNHGFDLENVDPNLKKFFHKAGVDERALQDKDTRDFIYDFIDKHGGVEAALREVNSHDSESLGLVPPPPPRGQPSSLSSRPAPPSRAPPPVSQSIRSTPSHKAPPPPAPVKQMTSATPPPPAPAPPPPPPPAAQGLMTQMSSVLSRPPAAPVSLPPVDSSHSNLMEAIRKGGSLRHVSPEKVNKAPVDTRCELMGQIRQGVALKKVDIEENEAAVEQPATGIAGLLQRALQERGTAMGMSSSEGEDSGEDDEWDD